MKKTIFFYILFVILLFFGCDFENLTGYKYESQKPDNTIQISGQITNIFTNEPVENMRLKIGIFETMTDAQGIYSLVYVKGEDENMNYPIPVEVRSHLYEDFNRQIYIGVTNIDYNIELVYAAPLFLDALYKKVENQFEVDVKDYQGFSDIKSITGVFSIAMVNGSNIGSILYDTISFSKGNALSFQTGKYNATIMEDWFEYNPKEGKNRFKFIMVDQENHCDTTGYFYIHDMDIIE